MTHNDKFHDTFWQKFDDVKPMVKQIFLDQYSEMFEDKDLECTLKNIFEDIRLSQVFDENR